MRDSRLKIWVLASRPKTLWIAVSPVMIGTAMAYGDGKAHWLSAFLAALGAVLIQIGTNLSNDYFDYVHGVDKEERLGPMRVTQAGLVKPQVMKRAFIMVYALAALATLYLICRAGWPILVIGVLSIASGILYTAGPFPLGYHGLGDIFVLIFFGLAAVGGTYYVQALEINTPVLLAGLAPGLLSTAILSVNNLRDVYTDKEVGKKTLPVRFGETFGRMEYLFCIVIPCLIPIILVAITRGHHFCLASSLVFLLALPSIRIILHERPGSVYNQVLAKTGILLLTFSLLFSIGWIL
ncbi:MAG: 1,4-dihydroxy-2-naphthoate polyprenyltransferase [bacterium]